MVQSEVSPPRLEHSKPPVPEKKEQSTFSFGKFAADIAYWTGTSAAFMWACAGIVLWGVTGPHYHYSDTWQLIVNTSTTIITFLMVFLIQNTQNRDTRALNLKLDEIIRSHKHAHNELIDIEKLTDAELEELAQHYERIRAEADHRKAAEELASSKENRNVA